MLHGLSGEYLLFETGNVKMICDHGGQVVRDYSSLMSLQNLHFKVKILWKEHNLKSPRVANVERRWKWWLLFTFRWKFFTWVGLQVVYRNAVRGNLVDAMSVVLRDMENLEIDFEHEVRAASTALVVVVSESKSRWNFYSLKMSQKNENKRKRLLGMDHFNMFNGLSMVNVLIIFVLLCQYSTKI